MEAGFLFISQGAKPIMAIDETEPIWVQEPDAAGLAFFELPYAILTGASSIAFFAP